MSVWTLSLKQPLLDRVDASPIRMAAFRESTTAQIERIKLGKFALGDLFRVSCKGELRESLDRIVLEGDLTHCHHVASQHRHGEFIIDGSVGDWVGGPHGSSHIGMRGGLVHVRGNAGDYAGHRMRRGVLVVDGDVGVLVASQMIAGTVVVAGTVGAHAAYSMRRGTLVLPAASTFGNDRFTRPVTSFMPFRTLLARSICGMIPSSSAASDLLKRLELAGMSSRRGDLAVGGQGEILVPGRV